MSSGYIEIDIKDEIRAAWISEIGGRKRRIGPSIGLWRSHKVLREPIKFVPAVEVGPNEI